jgi:hypothetical protein
MKINIFSMNQNPKLFALGVLCVIGATEPCHAQGTLATATISGEPAGSLFDYTITLDNTGSTPIGTFWFGWIPGQFYLPTSPTSETPPSAWTATLTGGGPFAIEYNASATADALSPGSSLTFDFVSADSPAVLAGDSSAHPGTPITTSFVYSGDAAFSGTSEQFVVASVPEPGTTTLLCAGLGVIWYARRKIRAMTA